MNLPVMATERDYDAFYEHIKKLYRRDDNWGGSHNWPYLLIDPPPKQEGTHDRETLYKAMWML